MDLNKLNEFFAEWKDDNKAIIALSGGMTIIVFLILVFVGNSIPVEQQRANVFLWLLLSAAICAAIDVLNEKNWLFSFGDYGETWHIFFKALGLGTIFAVLLQLGMTFSLVPMAITGTTAINTLLSFFYIVIAASYVEEKFFRGWLNNTTGNILRELGFPIFNVLGVVLTSVVFGVFHWSMYGGHTDLIIIAAVWGFVVSVGNYYCKSRGFSIAAHAVTNFMVIGGFTTLSRLVS